jgi:hypothetical protein
VRKRTFLTAMGTRSSGNKVRFRNEDGDGYTNIEKYINGLGPRRKVNWKDLRNNRDPLMTAR